MSEEHRGRAVKCGGCGGNGACSQCNGSGIRHRTFWWTAYCRRCKGKGVCPGCAGSGWILLPPPVVIPHEPPG